MWLSAKHSMYLLSSIIRTTQTLKFIACSGRPLMNKACQILSNAIVARPLPVQSRILYDIALDFHRPPPFFLSLRAYGCMLFELNVLSCASNKARRTVGASGVGRVSRAAFLADGMSGNISDAAKSDKSCSRGFLRVGLGLTPSQE